jgi:hypothetical protein
MDKQINDKQLNYKQLNDKQISVTIYNKLIEGKRDMNIYHHSTRSAHMISFDSSITLPFNANTEGDFLHLSIVSGPGRLDANCVVNLPSWIDFEFSSKGDVTVFHSGNRIMVKIPPGLPIWQLKMTRSRTRYSNISNDRITIDNSQ